MADATNGEGRNKKPKRDKHVKVKVGGEFKAKNAGGDVKRVGGPDPFAYLPLGHSGKKGGKSSSVNITGKKRGSAA
ncbi:hypothetical protein BDY24DRAFT_256844 [Mrakia frigida]|uniref:uncharacterized protein n=1 Tax=Mrakia frigida TaxID=29902 RepID=UPI003FCC1E87